MCGGEGGEGVEVNEAVCMGANGVCFLTAFPACFTF